MQQPGKSLQSFSTLVVGLVAAVVMFSSLGQGRLWDEDEPKNAACAREMLERNDWVVPTFNQQLRTDKPILLYWLTMAAYKVLGVSEFSARFWSASLMVGSAVCTSLIGRKLYGDKVGLLGGVIFGTSVLVGVSGRAATPDSTLIFCCTLAVWLFVQSGDWSQDWGKRLWLPHESPLLPKSWGWFVAAYACLGLAVLAKGPVGLLLPVAVLGLTLWVSNIRQAPADCACPTSLRSRLWLIAQSWVATTWSMRPVTLIATVLLVAVPWYVMVGIRTEGAWLDGFFGKHNFARFQQPLEGHHGPVIYYLVAILIGMFPWSLFLPLGIWTFFRQAAKQRFQPYGSLLLCCWVLVWVGLFSFSGTKLPSYVLPAYPALSLMLALWLVRWLEGQQNVALGWFLAAYGSAVAIGLAMLVGLRSKWDLFTGQHQLSLVGGVLVIGAVGAVVCILRQQRLAALIVTGAMALAFCTASFSIAHRTVSLQQDVPRLLPVAEKATEKFVENATGEIAPEPKFATYKFSPPSLVFYSTQVVDRCTTAEEVADFFRQHPQGVVVTLDRYLDEALLQLPDEVQPVYRESRFLKPKEQVVLLARLPESDVKTDAE